MNPKPKLSFEDLYNKIINKGISHRYQTKEDIIKNLSEKNYYYRLISYRKNYKKDNSGKYIGLDFKALEDLASLDTYLREYLLHLCLDIEHLLKTNLMTHITNNDNEDGYKLVNDFKVENTDLFNKIENQFKNNRYKTDMFNKRSLSSIWVLLEVIDLGTLINFIKFYMGKYPSYTLVKSDLLYFVKNVRNACAHNDVFLINLFHETNKIKQRNSSVVSYAALMKINDKKDKRMLYYNKINDIVMIHYLHHKLSSESLKTRRHNEGYNVINRFNKNISLHLHSSDINKFLKLLTQCVDYSKPKMLL